MVSEKKEEAEKFLPGNVFVPNAIWLLFINTGNHADKLKNRWEIRFRI